MKEDGTCDYCDTPINAPNFAYHFCVGRKEKCDSEKKQLRPRVDRLEDLQKLADELKSTPTAIVNFCVDVGIEVMSRSKDEMIKHFKDVLKNKLK